MLISLRGVRNDEILGGRQLVTKNGLYTVIGRAIIGGRCLDTMIQILF